MTLLERYNKNLSSFSFQFTKHYILKELIEISYLDILIGERVAQFFKYLQNKNITKMKQRKRCTPSIKSLKKCCFDLFDPGLIISN